MVWCNNILHFHILFQYPNHTQIDYLYTGYIHSWDIFMLSSSRQCQSTKILLYNNNNKNCRWSPIVPVTVHVSYLYLIPILIPTPHTLSHTVPILIPIPHAYTSYQLLIPTPHTYFSIYTHTYTSYLYSYPGKLTGYGNAWFSYRQAFSDFCPPREHAQSSLAENCLNHVLVDHGRKKLLLT